jgi:hypothetical protein
VKTPNARGSVHVLGLVDAVGPIRSIEANALYEAIRHLSSKPRLEPVRELTAELDRLDQEGIPGLKIKLNFFVLEEPMVPDLAEEDLAAVAERIEVGFLTDERECLRAEIDARVARAWGLTRDDLGVIAGFQGILASLAALPGEMTLMVFGRGMPVQ